MPYKIRKLPNRNKWRVYNPDTGHIYARETSKAKAEQQKSILNRMYE